MRGRGRKKELKGYPPRPDRWARARSLIEMYRSEQHSIPILLENAWLLSPPTCPELDEPVAAAKARAERMRAHNVRALLLIYRDQIKRGQIDERIRSFFAEQAELRVWCSDDPAMAMREFLGTPERGAPRRNAMRDFDLAAEIQKLRDCGMSVSKACSILCERLQATGGEPDEQYLKKLYFRETKHPVGKRAVAAWAHRPALGNTE